MKTAIISDIHFNPFKPFATMDTGINGRFLEIIHSWEWAMKDAVHKGCETVFVAGDVFHTRGTLRPSVFNTVFGCFATTAKYLEILIIPGNHDMENYRGGATAVDCFHELANVHVAMSPEVIRVNGAMVACIPYIHDHEEFKQVFAEMCNDFPEVDAFLIHQGIDNFANPGMPELGVTVKWLREQTGVPVISGHYHKPHVKDKVLSPGSLVQHGFGDSGEHGYWIWDTDDSSFEFVCVPGPEFVSVTTAVQAKKTDGKYVRVIADTVKNGEKIKKAAEKAGAKGVMLKMEKSYTTAHSQTIAIGGPKEMLTEYLNLKHADKAAELTKLFEKICEGATAPTAGGRTAPTAGGRTAPAAGGRTAPTAGGSTAPTAGGRTV